MITILYSRHFGTEKLEMRFLFDLTVLCNYVKECSISRIKAEEIPDLR